METRFDQCVNKFLFTYNLIFRVETTCDDETGNVLQSRISFWTRDKNQKEIGYIQSDISRNNQIILFDAIMKNFHNLTFLKIGIIYLLLTYGKKYNIQKLSLSANPHHDNLELCLHCYYQKIGFRQIPGTAIKVDGNRFISQLEMDANPKKLIKYLEHDIQKLCS